MGELTVNDREKRDTYRIPWAEGVAMIATTLLCWLWLGGGCSRWLSLLYRDGQPWLESFMISVAVIFSPFLCMGLGIWISLAYIIRMPLCRFTTDAPRFRWKLAIVPLVITFLSYGGFEAIGYLGHPDRYILKFTSDWGPRLISLPLLLILIPFQTSCEELLFRCLPARLFYGKLPKAWGKRFILCLLSALLFIVPHLANPDLTASEKPYAVLTYYALFGGLAMASALLTGGFEMALGIHAANNLFISLICGYPHSPLPGIPLMTNLRTLDGWTSCVQLLATFAIPGLVLYSGSNKLFGYKDAPGYKEAPGQRI
jgi:membrane protease YdiL (CAAX protease family)